VSGTRNNILIRPQQRKRYTRFGTWKPRSLHRSDSLTAARELARYKLGLVGVQEVMWDKGDTIRTGDCDFFLRKMHENNQMGTGVSVHKRLRKSGL
jgi:hypothetical protein